MRHRSSDAEIDAAALRIAAILLRDVGPEGRPSRPLSAPPARHPAMRPVRIVGVTSPEEWEARRQAALRATAETVPPGPLPVESGRAALESTHAARHKRMRCRNCGRIRENSGRGLCSRCYHAVRRAEKRSETCRQSK